MKKSARPPGGSTNGSSPLEDAPSISGVQRFAPLEFDPAEFMHFVEDEELSEAEATELLQAIWDIMVAWVDLGFDIHPVQQAMDKSSTSDAKAPLGLSDMIGLAHQNSNTTTNRQGAESHAAEKEES